MPDNLDGLRGGVLEVRPGRHHSAELVHKPDPKNPMHYLVATFPYAGDNHPDPEYLARWVWARLFYRETEDSLSQELERTRSQLRTVEHEHYVMDRVATNALLALEPLPALRRAAWEALAILEDLNAAPSSTVRQLREAIDAVDAAADAADKAQREGKACASKK